MLESKDAVLVATSIVLAVGTIVSLTIELERQISATGRLPPSKWFLVISTFFALVMTSIVCAAAAKGLGAPLSTAEFLDRQNLQKLIVAAFPPYFLCNMFVKHAWLTFYYGLTQTRAQRYFIHFMQVVAALFGVSSVIVILLQCIPLSHVWHHDSQSAECINLLAYFYFNASFMIANDVVMYLIPIYLLWDVEMLRDHRWSLYTLFGICGLVILASVFRLVAVSNVDKYGNLSENYALVFLWAAVENHVGICAACAGAIKARWCAAVRRVRTLSGSLRRKSWLLSYSAGAGTSSSTATRSQSTEERVLYERTDSLPSLNNVHVDTKDLGMRMELVQVVPSRQEQ